MHGVPGMRRGLAPRNSHSTTGGAPPVKYRTIKDADGKVMPLCSASQLSEALGDLRHRVQRSQKGRWTHVVVVSLALGLGGGVARVIAEKVRGAPIVALQVGGHVAGMMLGGVIAGFIVMVRSRRHSVEKIRAELLAR